MSGLSSVKLDDSVPVIPFSDTVKILGAKLDSTQVSLWDPTLKQHPSLVSITSDPLGKSDGHFCCFCFGLFASWLC